LGKKKYENPEFFRPYGVQWIDFKNRCIARRKEIDEIIKEFDKKDVVAMKGNPASGKSVILRNIGYELAKQGRKVYVVELKKEIPEKGEIMKLKNCYLLIDDVHIKPTFTDGIVRDLSDTKILISSREFDYRFGPTTAPQILEYFEDAIEIDAGSVADEIIEIFSEKKKKVSGEIGRKLDKNNLWILA